MVIAHDVVGPSLHKKERGAIVAYMKFERLYQLFVAELHPTNVVEWTTQIEAYEEDPNLPDPYASISSGTWLDTWRDECANTGRLGMTEAEVRLQLAREEDEQPAETTLHEITPAAMLANLLGLEEQQ